MIDKDSRWAALRYVVINKLVQKVLMIDFKPRKAEAVARQDWIEDSQGYFE
eukprot:COSAG02_NODE_51727_length_312_cov_0.784038_2_plen_50_part_01